MFYCMFYFTCDRSFSVTVIALPCFGRLGVPCITWRWIIPTTSFGTPINLLVTLHEQFSLLTHRPCKAGVSINQPVDFTHFRVTTNSYHTDHTGRKVNAEDKARIGKWTGKRWSFKRFRKVNREDAEVTSAQEERSKHERLGLTSAWQKPANGCTHPTPPSGYMQCMVHS